MFSFMGVFRIEMIFWIIMAGLSETDLFHLIL